MFITNDSSLSFIHKKYKGTKNTKVHCAESQLIKNTMLALAHFLFLNVTHGLLLNIQLIWLFLLVGDVDFRKRKLLREVFYHCCSEPHWFRHFDSDTMSVWRKAQSQFHRMLLHKRCRRTWYLLALLGQYFFTFLVSFMM